LQARQDYRVISLWEVEAEIALQQPLPTLLPFVPILRNGGDESTVRRALQLLRSNEQLDELEPLLAFFATFVLEIPLVQQIMRWDMAVLRESPWYQEILQQGLKQGLLSGIALGLELKFGAAGLELMPEIREISDVERLMAIQEGIKTVNSLEQLQAIYRS
jgi:predicted transposase YdaD